MNRQAMAESASPADSEHPGRAHQRVLVESVAAAVCAYVASAALETAVIRSLRPTEWELAWVSDVALATAFGSAVYLWRHLLNTRRQLQERERAQLVVQTQLSIAAEIQRQLLPPVPPPDLGFEWAAALSSAGKIGGDFYDFVQVGPSRWIVLVADVSGKGIPAAMALGSLRSAFRALAHHSPDPERIVADLSKSLYDDWRGSLYVTCLVATFTCASAQSCQPMPGTRRRSSRDSMASDTCVEVGRPRVSSVTPRSSVSRRSCRRAMCASSSPTASPNRSTETIRSYGNSRSGRRPSVLAMPHVCARL